MGEGAKMGTGPRYYAILVVDIEGFGKRRSPIQMLLRERLYRILDEAIGAVGIDVTDVPAPADRGDGAFWLLPASIPKVMLTGPFITALQAELQAHERVSTREAHMRLRVALHAGEVSRDQHGWVGEDLNTACRLVDLQSLRDALARATRSPLVLAVSDSWYHSTVRPGYPGVDSSTYYPVPFHAKEVNQTAWITVPGYPDPPTLADGAEEPTGSGGVPPAGGGPAPDGGTHQEDGEGRAAVAAAPDTARVANVGPFAGATIRARRVYGGNHYEGGGSK
jgi:hypothetical protein